MNLNGLWDFAVRPSPELPGEYPETILVPFAPESLLSGIHRAVPEGASLFYRRTFTLPDGFEGGRVLLHIGAADQEAEVYLNGNLLGGHIGGYQPFSFDITEALAAENELVIRVVDRLSLHELPYGKQRQKRGGMWYTPVSGIWQTVWLEAVPEEYISSLRIRTGADWVEFEAGTGDGTVTIQTPEGALEVPLRGGKARAELEHPRLWSPEDPYLYGCSIRMGFSWSIHGKRPITSISSAAAHRFSWPGLMRKEIAWSRIRK